MTVELALNKSNRLKLARAFQHNKRVDYAIDCAVEGQMGQAFANDVAQPTAFGIVVGPFCYFAGDVHSPDSQTLIRELLADRLLMPSPPEWMEVAQKVFQNRLVSFPRHSFSAEQLSEAHLASLSNSSPHRERIVPLDAPLAAQTAAEPDNYLEIEAFDSPEDFVDRGLGFAALDGERVMGVAYSSLVCSRGIEVSIFVKERYRERGVATALAGRLLLAGHHEGMRPNWDAANPESCKLALKLGFVFVESYEAYYVG